MSRLWAKSPATLVAPAGSAPPKNVLPAVPLTCVGELFDWKFLRHFFRSTPVDITTKLVATLLLQHALENAQPNSMHLSDPQISLTFLAP